MKKNDAVGIILAGGRGSRLTSITPLYFKTLLEINGLPVVAHAARALKPFVHDIIVVASPSNSSKIARAVSKGINSSPAALILAIQQKTLGVANAIGVALEKVLEDRPVVVICGDNIVEAKDVKTVLDCVQSDTAELASTKLAWTYKEFESHIASRFAVWAPAHSGDGMLIEKPVDPPSKICWCGPLAFRSSHDVRYRIGKLLPSSRGEYEVTDLLNTYLKNGESSRFPLKGLWFDIGTPQALNEARDYMSNRSI